MWAPKDKFGRALKGSVYSQGTAKQREERARASGDPGRQRRRREAAELRAKVAIAIAMMRFVHIIVHDSFRLFI
jgi:hypothetical protein